MNEQYVSRLAIGATVAWATVFLLTGAAWVAALVRPEQVPIWGMLALTAGVLAPLAAVLTIRRYVVRVCRLIRNTRGYDEGERLHAVP
jgi:hypothetical protein